ncbi:MAG: 50S ribosomal protein L25 [Firmicutes bacterium]|nr:50S ribosomal protein L25 [Bacillota bacterium]
MAQFDLKAAARTEKGKSYRKQLMNRGWVPGVVYGKKMESLPVELEWRTFHDVMNSGGRNAIINIKVENAGDYQVMVKDMQFDAIKKFLMHVDFQQISMSDAIEVNIPINVDGEIEEGILQIILRELNISCLPGNIPEGINVDVSKLHVGDTLSVNDLEIPEGVEVIDDPEATILTVSSETVAEPEDEEEGEEEEPAEGEAESAE